jgi:hypothetical protein
MAIRVNQSGTWRNTITHCVNQAGTWRRVVDGCVNQSSTWRCFGSTAPTVTLSNSGNIVRCATPCTSTLTWSSTRATSVASSNFGVSATSGTCVVSSGATYNITMRNAFADSSQATSTVSVSNPSLGTSMQGGFLICIQTGLFWIVAPSSSQVSRSWYCRNDANTTAQQVSGCTGWFVPTMSQLQNPGYCCRSFWGPSPCFSSMRYWSSTELNARNACYVNFTNGANGPVYSHSFNKHLINCIRAFRCVTY